MEITRTAHAAARAGEVLSALLKEHEHRPVLVLFSGGSSLAMLSHVTLTTYPHTLALGVLDERYTSDPDAQNTRALQETDFFRTARTQGAYCIVPDLSGGRSLAESASAYEEALHTWRSAHEDAVVIVTMGIGHDGHTAGLFPGIAPEEDGGAWVVAYEVPPSVSEYTARMSVSYTFLTEEVDAAVAYAVGSEKAPVVRALREDPCTISAMPACVLHKMRTAHLVTDCGA